MLYAVDTETTSLNPHTGGRAFLITWCNELGETDACRVGVDSIINIMLICQNRDNQIIGHNLAFDMAFLKNLGIEINGTCHDTMLAAHIHNPLEPSKALKALAKKYLHSENKEEAALEQWFVAHGMKADAKREYIRVPEEIIIPYALADVRMTMHLWKHYKKLGIIDNSAYKLECSIIPVCEDIVRNGMQVDKAFAEREALRTAERAHAIQIQAKDMFQIANIGSNAQLAEYLKREYIEKQGLKLEDFPKTEGGDQLSMDAIALQEYAHPLAELAIEYRDMIKMNGTYLQAMLHLTDTQGRLHASLNQVGARTGRFSSSSPNLQNIPRSGGCVDVRRGFVCRDEGWRLLLIDLSQIELRVLAHYCREPKMVEALSTRSGDLHAATAELMFQSKEKKYRTIAKTLNFAVIYGAGGKKLMDTLNRALPDANFTLEQTKHFKATYFEQFPRVRDFMWKLEAMIKERAMLSTERIGWIQGLSGRRYFCEADAAYKSLNALIQGESAMFFKNKMAAIHPVLKGRRTKLINVIHDELIFDLAKEDDDLIPLLLNTIEDVHMFRVPIYANAAISSTNWAEKSTLIL